MSNYTKATNFAAKDSLPAGDSGKIIKGTEFNDEFDAIATAIATKFDSASAVDINSGAIDGATIGASSAAAGTFTELTVNTSFAGSAVLDEDDMSSDSATKVATQQSIKAYVDSKLIDYVQGTFTPTVTDGSTTATVGTATGAYFGIRVSGTLVLSFLSIRLLNIDTTGLTGSSSLRIESLPTAGTIESVRAKSQLVDTFSGFNLDSVGAQLTTENGGTGKFILKSVDETTSSTITVSDVTSGSNFLILHAVMQ